MLWVLHVILSQALKPSTIARNWARSLSWEIRLLRSLAALGRCMFWVQVQEATLTPAFTALQTLWFYTVPAS